MSVKRNVGIVGVGTFGHHLALTLEKLGQQVLAIDKDAKALEKVKDYVTTASILDATDKQALLDSGITSCDLAVVCIGKEIDASILSVFNLTELGVKTIIARAKKPEEEMILAKVGASKIINPEKDSAIRLANQITSSDILEFIEVSPDYQAAEVLAPNAFVGKTIEKLHVNKTHRILILAIRRGSKTLIIPQTTETIKKQDTLVVVGQTGDVIEFVNEYAPKNKNSAKP